MFEIVNPVAVLFATGVPDGRLGLLRHQQAEEALRLRRGRALEYSLTRRRRLDTGDSGPLFGD